MINQSSQVRSTEILNTFLSWKATCTDEIITSLLHNKVISRTRLANLLGCAKSTTSKGDLCTEIDKWIAELEAQGKLPKKTEVEKKKDKKNQSSMMRRNNSDSKLRGCDLVNLKISDISYGNKVMWKIT